MCLFMNDLYRSTFPLLEFKETKWYFLTFYVSIFCSNVGMKKNAKNLLAARFFLICKFAEMALEKKYQKMRQEKF